MYSIVIATSYISMPLLLEYLVCSSANARGYNDDEDDLWWHGLRLPIRS